MRKIFTTAFLIAATSFAFGQTFKFFDTHNNNMDVTNGQIDVYVDANNAKSYQTEVGLQNTTSDTVYYKMERIFTNGNAGTGNDVYFCAGTQCYPPDTGMVFTTILEHLLPNQILPDSANPLFYGILADFDLNVVPRTTDLEVLYKIYNTKAGTSDTSTVTIMYKASQTSINELTLGSLSDAYPNPSNTVTSINYNMNNYVDGSKILIYDMLGKAVKEIEIEEQKGTVKLEVAEMTAGVYFYSFVIDDKTVATKKLIVSSK